MDDYTPTDAGYELLKKTGLEEKIDKNWKKINEILPYTMLVEDYEIEEILEQKNNLRLKAVKTWASSTEEFDRKPEDLLMVSGKLTDCVLLRREAKEFSKHFKNLQELDGLIAAYCFSKKNDEYSFSKKPFVWRANGFKTRIFGDMHGDLQISQITTKPGKEKNKTLDGVVNEQLFGKLPWMHVNADYCFWTHLVATAMKYADTLGLEIKEIKNWQDLLKQYGWDGEIKDLSDGWGVGYQRFKWEYTENILAQLPDKTNVREVKKMFFGWMAPHANHKTRYFPIIDEEQNLVIYANYTNDKKQKSITLAPSGVPEMFYPKIVISKSEADMLFKGAVHGIMTGQSRTRPEYFASMMQEYDDLKSGKYEKIFEELRRKIKDKE